MNDQFLIEQAYSKIYENKSILIPRRSGEERQKNYQIALQKQVKEYMKNGGVVDLDLVDTLIYSLPEGLKVGGSLYLSNTRITSLPEGLKVGGSLNLSFTTTINSLPEGLEVGGNLSLYMTNITTLPEGLKIGGGLNLQYTEINSLPKTLTVGDGLNLIDTPISKKYTKEQLKQMLPNVEGEIYI